MNKRFVAFAGGTVMSLSLVMPTFAQVGTSTLPPATKTQIRAQTKANNVANKIKNVQAKGDTEITNRINSLDLLVTRVQAMKNLSDANKSTLVSNIQAVLADMNTLKTKIDSDTATSTLTADYKSITADYRVYALVLPQTSLLAAADRIDIIVAEMQTVSSKLQTRISSAQGSGADVTAANSSLADLNSKISDASAQANAIIQEVIALVPDKGDKTIAASNTAAIKDARAKLKTANQDLKTARADITAIQKAIKSVTKNSTATSTV